MAIVPQFRKATRVQCKLSCAIEGLSGSGKSGLALAIARTFADWDKIYAVDTENKSLDLFVENILHTGERIPKGALNVADLLPEDGYRPSHYEALRNAALAAHGEVIIFDSLSHLWQYKGGILDMVNQKQAEAGRNYNKYTAWGDPEIVAEKNAIMSLVRHANIHTICTIRAKEKMEIVPGEDGKNVVQSLGEQQIMMPDFKYEPDLVLHMLAPGEYREDGKTAKAPKVRVVKSRYRIMRRDEEYDVTPELLHQLRQYLEEGTSPEELLEMQRKDYIEGVKTYLDEHPNARVIWQVLKNDAGLQDVKLNDMQLKDLKLLFNQVAAE